MHRYRVAEDVIQNTIPARPAPCLNSFMLSAVYALRILLSKYFKHHLIAYHVYQTPSYQCLSSANHINPLTQAENSFQNFIPISAITLAPLLLNPCIVRYHFRLPWKIWKRKSLSPPEVWTMEDKAKPERSAAARDIGRMKKGSKNRIMNAESRPQGLL